MKLRASVLAATAVVLLSAPLAPQKAEAEVLPVVVGVVAGAIVWPYLVPAAAVAEAPAAAAGWGWNEAASWQWQHALAMPAVVGGIIGGLLGYAVGR